MKFVFYTCSVSPHQIPLARELVACLGRDNYRYVHAGAMSEERRKLGWSEVACGWIVSEEENRAEARRLLEDCDVLLSGLRDLDLFEKRSRAGKRTIYCGERWFKPTTLFRALCISGKARMLVPSYRRMAHRFVKLVREDPHFSLLPMGIHAARDFAWLLGGEIERFERRLGGRVFGRGKGLDKIRVFGYTVAPGGARSAGNVLHDTVRVLWVGRFLRWKRVADIIRAVCRANRLEREGCQRRIALTLVGSGPEEARLKRLARRLRTGDRSPLIAFLPPVPVGEVRKLMHEHDLYVLSSDAHEGWGAAVSEAIEEGMRVVGTYEAGASATVLGEGALYHAGDVQRLACMIAEGGGASVERKPWSAKTAARTLLGFVGRADADEGGMK